MKRYYSKLKRPGKIFFLFIILPLNEGNANRELDPKETDR
jgi:hypothetical protein